MVQMVREGAETGYLPNSSDFMQEFEVSRRTVANSNLPLTFSWYSDPVHPDGQADAAADKDKDKDTPECP